MNDPVAIRDFNHLIKGEREYVLSTWLRDLRDADPSGLPDDLWYPAHRDFIEDVLSDRDHRCAVACAADDPTDLLGYAVARPNEVLEWVHVRRQFRGRGLAARLLSAVGAGPTVPARFRTRSGSDRLLNPWRPREIRQGERDRSRSSASSAAPRSNDFGRSSATPRST